MTFALVLLAIYIVLAFVVMIFATARGWFPWTYGELLLPVQDARHPYHRDWKEHHNYSYLGERNKWGDMTATGNPAHPALATILWPLALIYAIFRIAFETANTSRKNKASTREALEKELADAKAEVESLLKPKK